MEAEPLWQELTALKGDRRIALLEAIAATGSITHAARQLGIAYKTAWDTLDALHQLSAQPLVISQAGGRQGGGCVLTAAGRALIEHYRHLEAEVRAGGAHAAGLWGRLRLQTSARNHFIADVLELQPQGLACDLICALLGGTQTLRARVTGDSVRRLRLQAGREVHLLFKASALQLARRCEERADEEGTWLAGHVGEVQIDGGQVELRLDGGSHLRYFIVCSLALYERLQLQEGAAAYAFCPAAAIIVGVEDERL